MPRNTRSARYASIKENMGPPGNEVKLKNGIKNSNMKPSKTIDKENSDIPKAPKSAKMRSPLGEKNVAQVITNERRASVREGAKKSANKITEFCRTIRNSKSIKDKENDGPETQLLTQDKQKIKESTATVQGSLTEKPNEIANSSKTHVFASPQPVPIRKSVKTPVAQTPTPPTVTRRLSVREGARKSKDKIAEICRAIKNTKPSKAPENTSPQKAPNGDVDLVDNTISPVVPQKQTKKTKATKNREILSPPIAPTRRRRCYSPENKSNQDTEKEKTPLGNNKKNEKTTITTSTPRMSKRKCVKPVLSESNKNPQKAKVIPVQKQSSKTNTQKTTVKDKENTSPLKRKLVTLPTKIIEKPTAKRIINKDFSFRVLEEKSEDVQNKEAVYEFTFDPSEEPPPLKKKRKQAARKKPKAKPKPVFINNNYEENISKKLQNLKESVNKRTGNQEQNIIVASKPTTQPAVMVQNAQKIQNQTVPQTKQVQIVTEKPVEISTVNNKTGNQKQIIIVASKSTIQPATMVQTAQKIQKQMAPQTKQVQIVTERPVEISTEPEPRIDSPIFIEPIEPEIVPGSSLGKGSKDNSRENNIEDIEAQWDPVENDNDNLNYSPVRMSFNNVLSSTLNGSTRQPQDSPWRPDFETLPFKWHANSYVKPNMTPAVETSFVISDKKHVYTNMLQDDDTPPDIVEKETDKEKETPKLKQSSIMSFIGETTERTTRRTRNQKKGNGPSRANLPRTALNLAPSSDVVEKLYNQIKTATDAPEVPERNDDGTTASEPVINENADSDSVHLFEDIDIVHHLKPTRKSYGKAKKLTFCKTVVDNTAQHVPEHDSDSDDERQALDDMTFDLPTLKTKKPVKKKKKAAKFTKKEEEEAEAWAAAFNSMCEEVEEFPLLTE